MNEKLKAFERNINYLIIHIIVQVIGLDSIDIEDYLKRYDIDFLEILWYKFSEPENWNSVVQQIYLIDFHKLPILYIFHNFMKLYTTKL